MSTIRVDPRKVKVVEMRDGTRYPVGRNGTVAITAGRHEKELADVPTSAYEVGETGFLAPGLGFIDVPGKTCACGFEAWPWQGHCPRCGEAL